MRNTSPVHPVGGRQRWAATYAALALLAVDTAVTVALFASAWAHPSAVTAGRKTDAPYTVWALAWVARAVAHGHSPWVTHALSWPSGVNLLTNATATGFGLALAPVTWLWGPLTAFNVAATASLAATAWSAQLVLRRIGMSWPAAAVGGLVAGFGPLSVAQTGGAHLHVSAAFLAPPFLLGIARLANPQVGPQVGPPAGPPAGSPAGPPAGLPAGPPAGPRAGPPAGPRAGLPAGPRAGPATKPPVKWGVAIGLLAAAQLLIGEELLAILAITAAVGVAAAALVAGPIAWRRLALGLAIAAATFVAVAGWPLATQFFGPGHIHGPIQVGVHYPNDAAAALVPAGPLWLTLGPIGRIARHFSSEGGAYLGLPLVLLMAAAVVRRWRDPRVRVAAVAGATLLVLSFGERLVVAGHRTPLPLPWAGVAKLPLLDSLIPVRFGIIGDLLAGGFLAFAIDEVVGWVRSRDAKRHRHYRKEPLPAAAIAIPSALALLCLLPLMPRLPFSTSRWSIPAYFRSPPPPSAPGAIPDGSLIVLGPYPRVSHPESEIWLAAAGARWASGGGSYFVPDAHGRVTIGGPASPAAEVETSLEDGVPFVVDQPTLLAQLAHDRVVAVVIGPVSHRDEVIAWWTVLLGPSTSVGGVDVFRVTF